MMDAPAEGTREARFPRWAAALADQDAFRQEQARLGRIWTFLGLTFDVAKDNDWFTARLGGRSVFVQRFGGELKGYENRCAHRFFPLRRKEKGNGPIKCGFHDWEYNKRGFAVRIPRCKDLFGVTPRELNARIAPIEVATCGSLVFGRFQHPHANETLQQFLGEAWPIIETMCTMKRRPHAIKLNVQANWKLSCHISLDEYHGPSVHPTLFGKEGYPGHKALRYFRFGMHNAFFAGGDEHAMQVMADGCRDGTYRPVRYRIFQFFPNLLIANFRAQKFWYVNVHQIVPLAPDRSRLDSWYFRAPFETGRGAIGRWLDSATEPVRAPLVGYYVRKLHSEDIEVVEQLQQSAAEQSGWPRISRAEERIRWFEENYAKVLAD